jgi:uncharacterized membrane protein YqaE (UPF0057 family)
MVVIISQIRIRSSRDSELLVLIGYSLKELNISSVRGVNVMNNKIVLIILAILLAPLAVFLKKGAGKDLIINIILCFLFYIPAVIHALILVT